jgi:hypothetical protein
LPLCVHKEIGEKWRHSLLYSPNKKEYQSTKKKSYCSEIKTKCFPQFKTFTETD